MIRMIKAIVFDTGGVLINEIAGEAREMVAKKFGFSGDDFGKVSKKYLNNSYTGGHYNSFFQKVVEELNLSVSYKELVDEWLNVREKTSSVNEDIKKMIIKLKKKYLIGMLSNSTILNEKVSARKSVLSLFDDDLRIFSFECGFRKPDKKIYDILLERLEKRGILPEETVFIDDREENLIPAESLGMKTILFKDANRLKEELKNFEVNV